MTRLLLLTAWVVLVAAFCLTAHRWLPPQDWQAERGGCGWRVTDGGGERE